MMRILLIEDEPLAAERLQQLIASHLPEAAVGGWVRSKREAAEWLHTHGLPDLIFSDIELLDGNVFGLYRDQPVSCPIIFATAYDQFLLQAFQTNGIAYLLKPYQDEQFVDAVTKYRRLFAKPAASSEAFLSAEVVRQLQDALRPTFRQYRERFTVKKAGGIFILLVTEVLFIQSEDNVVLAYARDGKRYPLNFTLNDLEASLNPAQFFRLNRGALVALTAIERIEPYFNDRLAVRLSGQPEPLISSAGRTAEFRRWVEGE